MAKNKDITSGTTSREAGHTHKFDIDEDGNGKTSWNDDHDHEVEKNLVLVARGHSHKLPPMTSRFKKILKGDKR